MSELTRRVFLGQAGVATVAGAAAAGEISSSKVSQADKFRPLIGQTFRISTDGKSWTKCKLDEVKDLGPAPRSHLPKPVSMLFSTADGVELQQDTYVVAHSKIPAQRLLVTPIHHRDQQLEVIFA